MTKAATTDAKRLVQAEYRMAEAKATRISTPRSLVGGSTDNATVSQINLGELLFIGHLKQKSILVPPSDRCTQAIPDASLFWSFKGIEAWKTLLEPNITQSGSVYQVNLAEIGRHWPVQDE